MLIHRRVNRRIGLASAALAFVVGLVAQPTSLDRLVFVETNRLHLALASGQGPASASPGFPKQIASGEYSPDFFRRTILPAMGGTVAVGDFDADGHPDLYVVLPGGSNRLLRGEGDGTFRDVTAKAGVAGPEGSLSATFADYDRSGRPSLFVAGAAGIVLYHNNGNGKFLDVTRQAGLRIKAGELCTRAVLADVDGDGFPELLVTVYTDFNRAPAKAAFSFPNDFSGGVSRLYRNNGDGTFTDVTAAAGLAENPGRARNAVFADFNNDRMLDLLVLRDDKPPALYLNSRGGKFRDATWEAGEPLTRQAFLDAQTADFNGDGKPDLALWSASNVTVLLNSGNAVFERATSVPLLSPLASPFGFHGLVADLDGNGLDDLVALDSGGRWRFYLNRGGLFHEVPGALSLDSGSHSAVAPATLLPVFSSVTPLRLEGQHGIHLLALRPDGRITVFRGVSQ
jgi:hypothetical protein